MSSPDSMIVVATRQSASPRRKVSIVASRLQLPQQLLLADAEALLLVDDHEPEVAGTNVAREQAVGPDQDLDPALGEPPQRLADLGRLAQARDHLDLDRELGEALAEGPEVLLGEDRRR